MVAKSLLRNNKPVIIALATNDGLGLNLKNIGTLMATESIYFVPMGQDDFVHKPHSLVSDLNKVPQTLELALQKEQIQPIFIIY